MLPGRALVRALAAVAALAPTPATSDTAAVARPDLTPACDASCLQLRGALADADPRVRRDALLRKAQDADAESRRAGTQDQARARATAMVEPLRAELLLATRDPDAGVRLLAATLLRYVRPDDSVVRALVETSADANREVRYPALASLAAVGADSADAHRAALAWVRFGDPTQFESGAYLAGRWQLADAIPALTAALDADDPAAVRDAAAALAGYGAGAATAIPALRRARDRSERLARLRPSPTPATSRRPALEGPFPAAWREARTSVDRALLRVAGPPAGGVAILPEPLRNQLRALLRGDAGTDRPTIAGGVARALRDWIADAAGRARIETVVAELATVVPVLDGGASRVWRDHVRLQDADAAGDSFERVVVSVARSLQGPATVTSLVVSFAADLEGTLRRYTLAPVLLVRRGDAASVATAPLAGDEPALGVRDVLGFVSPLDRGSPPDLLFATSVAGSAGGVRLEQLHAVGAEPAWTIVWQDEPTGVTDVELDESRALLTIDRQDGAGVATATTERQTLLRLAPGRPAVEATR